MRHMTNASGWGGTRAQRARDYLAHQLRASWLRHAPLVCPRCQLPIEQGQAWDVGHTHSIQTRPDLMWSLPHLRAEHASCNRADGARITTTNRERRRKAEWKW